MFRAFREEQGRITDRDRPCLLIDHPEAFRRIAKYEGCRPAKNMPGGYLDGEIARTFDRLAAEWKATELPALPAVAERQEGRESQRADASAAAGGE